MSILGVLGGSLLTGFGSAIENGVSNLPNYIYQSNEAAKNRDFQAQMQQNQFDFQEQMFKKTNEWNSAKAQAQRWREAGFNPYLMMSQGANAGSATAMSGAGASGGSSPSGGFAADPVGFRRNEIAFMDALTNKDVGESQVAANNATARKENADASIKEIQTLHEEARLNLLLAGMRKDNETKDIANLYQPKLYDASIRHRNKEIDVLAQEERGRKIANAIANKELAGYDAVFKLKVAQLAADIRDKIATEGLKIEQAQRTWYDGLHELEKLSGTKLDNDKKRAIFDAEVEKSIQETLPAIGKYGKNGGDWFMEREYGQYPKY